MSKSEPMNVEMQVGFDGLGNASLHIVLDGIQLPAMPVDSAERFAMMVLSSVVTGRARGALFRGLILEGWDVDEAVAFTGRYKG